MKTEIHGLSWSNGKSKRTVLKSIDRIQIMIGKQEFEIIPHKEGFVEVRCLTYSLQVLPHSGNVVYIKEEKRVV